MKTRTVTRNMLTFSLLLIAARCLDAFIIHKMLHFPSESMNWTEARLYCQKNHLDLVTWDMVSKSEVAEALKSAEVTESWIGLRRDPENDSVWKWINLISREGLSGNNPPQSNDWAAGQQKSHCAVVGQDLKWHSAKCSSKYHYYCSNNYRSTIYYTGTYNWDRASEKCIGYGFLRYNLATITTTNKYKLTAVGWIGLYREAGDSWKWIRGDASDYRNWAPGEPITTDCGSFDSGSQKLHSKVCSEKHRFTCYDDNIVVVTENKTWEDALTHCRSMASPCEDTSTSCRYRYELLSLERLTDYNYVRGRIFSAETDEVWTSLRFLGGKWWWVDGQKLEDQGMLPDCPSPGKHCGTLSKYDTNNWIMRDCSEQRNFICYKEKFFPLG